MQVSDVEWSQAEQTIAKAAFEKAYEREMNALIEQVRGQASTIETLKDVWQLHDFLSAKRHDMDGKYDYQYASLIFVFATLVKEGWLYLDELEGLAADKLMKVAVLSRME
ncbi:hypothetical protein [Thermocoleostomius sinensis]|uniref:Fluorescence recovery protein n=1 Tax=Thermocoleostomius sinensis A174 TaxID=2016057 RepID=A0A9E9CCF9_9CYAN|nr:hypothetical protein [Thermocoleostomius sinensis]WAL62825.1 hypothetical protein OXH18_10415 [Thermocoleostomius sinensis A174]